ncbi:hypothetical protein DERF_001485, partial [Dermatophagoides farinae]
TMTRQNNNASQIIIIMTKQIFWKLACISLAMINLISLQNNASIFYTRKFLAIGFTLFEFEAIIEFINKYSQIMEYLMVGDDDLVIAILHSLFALGLIRFLLLQFGFYMANQKLNNQIRIKRLNPIQFGSGFIFFTDWSIIQLYVFTNYLYGFQMPMDNDGKR